MWGYIDPETFTDNTPITYEGYTGYDEMRSQIAELSRTGLNALITWLEATLNEYDVGITIADLGFTAY